MKHKCQIKDCYDYPHFYMVVKDDDGNISNLIASCKFHQSNIYSQLAYFQGFTLHYISKEKYEKMLLLL